MDKITWETDETFPEGTLLLTDKQSAGMFRGKMRGRLLLAAVRGGLLPGVIMENIGHEETDSTGGQEAAEDVRDGDL